MRGATRTHALGHYTAGNTTRFGWDLRSRWSRFRRRSLSLERPRLGLMGECSGLAAVPRFACFLVRRRCPFKLVGLRCDFEVLAAIGGGT